METTPTHKKTQTETETGGNRRYKREHNRKALRHSGGHDINISFLNT